ncbi:MAG: c-type cytochrome [Actinomycetota bacterium]|nr:c-type cytochrome [Actinomycetota bacterium]
MRGVLVITCLVAAATLAACGQEGIDVPGADEEVQEGALLFSQRCSGCHTMKAAGAQGTANRSQRAQGPNLDQRTESYEDAIYAIRNGGFSGAIMPQNIVVGADADKVARFLEEYSGSDVEDLSGPGS